jgi:hypothetical protein
METEHFDLIPPVKVPSHWQTRHLLLEAVHEQATNDQLWDEEDPPPVESSPPDLLPAGGPPVAPDDLPL